MKFTVMTLFPEQVSSFLMTSITGRAMKSGIIDLTTVHIRDYCQNRYGKVDDTMYGGGTGLLMQCEPVYRAYEDICASHPGEKIHTIYLSPKGTVFDQKKAIELSKRPHVNLLCGHYEGIDQRVLDRIVDEEISIGDFVLTGGEIAACVIIDAVSRMIPGVLPDASAYENESHMDGVLEAPQYTKPECWDSCRVPEVLMSGHHEKIREWKHRMSLYETWIRRPDLFAKLSPTREDWMFLLEEYRKNSSKIADNQIKPNVPESVIPTPSDSSENAASKLS